MLKHVWRASYKASDKGHVPLAVIFGSDFLGLKSLVFRIGVWAEFISLCLCARFAKTFGSGVSTSEGRYSVVSLW